MAEHGRIKPNSLEAERSVLGSMLIDSKCTMAGLEKLKEEDFYEPRHQEIFRIMRDLFGKSIAVDFVTVTENLEKNSKMAQGSAEYVAELTSSVPSTANFEYYLNIISEKAILRNVIDIGMEITSDAFDEKCEAGDILDRAGDRIYKIATDESSRSLTSIRQAMDESNTHLKAVMESKDGLLGIPTGFPELDQSLAGLQGTQLIIIAGRPGMGKTSFALNILEHVACNLKLPCLMFSLEMSASQLAGRMQCSRARVNAQHFRTGRLEKAEMDKLKEAESDLCSSPIYIDDATGVTITEILAKARNMKAKEGLGLIVIDYLQLMSSGSRVESRQQEVSQLSRSMKIMAKELNVPVIVLSQLSRANEKRDKNSRRPMLSDLRESGSIEQDADVVIFLHREDYYNDIQDLENMGTAEIIIAKQRSGPIRTIKAAFDAEFTRFSEIDNVHSDEDF